MVVTASTAFYPSRPFWAGSPLNFKVQRTGGWFDNQMIEEVYSNETDAYSLKLCRDGRILIRIAALESAKIPEEPPPAIEQTVQKWGDYLDYLNSYYLLLDSATIEVDHFNYFNLHEITNRDAFRVRFEDGKYSGENIAIESVASVFQMARYLSSYRPDIPLEMDSKLAMRHVISPNALKRAGESFGLVVSSPGMEKPLAAFAKSLSEYKVGNYETSLILAWFITESSAIRLWKTHLAAINKDLEGGLKRINADRRKFLTGRDFTASVVTNLLELFGVIDHATFIDIDAARGHRNKIVHGEDFRPGAAEAQLAMKTALTMIERLWGIHIYPSFGYSVTGI